MDLLLHIGHAKNEVEVALTVLGFAMTLLGLGVAVMALWPSRAPTRSSPRLDRVARRRVNRPETGGQAGDGDRTNSVDPAPR